MHQILHQAFFWEATEEKSHCLLHRSPLALLLDLCELLLNKIVVSSTSSRENSNEIHCKGNILLCEDLDQILSGKEIRGKGNIPLRSEPVCDIPYVIIETKYLVNYNYCWPPLASPLAENAGLARYAFTVPDSPS